MNAITVLLAGSVQQMAEHRIYGTANDWLDEVLKVVGIPAILPLVMAVLIVLFAWVRGRHEVEPDDPKVFLESVAAGEGLAESLILQNLGGSEALNVKIANIQPDKTKIDFAVVPLIPVGEKASTYPNQQNMGGLLRRNLTHELKAAWEKRQNSSNDTLPVQMTTTYENDRKIVFEAKCDLVFNGAMYSVNQEFWAKEMIQFANWQFKRLGKKKAPASS